jgi:hypothetical protein
MRFEVRDRYGGRRRLRSRARRSAKMQIVVDIRESSLLQRAGDLHQEIPFGGDTDQLVVAQTS